MEQVIVGVLTDRARQTVDDGEVRDLGGRQPSLVEGW